MVDSSLNNLTAPRRLNLCTDDLSAAGLSDSWLSDSWLSDSWSSDNCSSADRKLTGGFKVRSALAVWISCGAFALISSQVQSADQLELKGTPAPPSLLLKEDSSERQSLKQGSELPTFEAPGNSAVAQSDVHLIKLNPLAETPLHPPVVTAMDFNRTTGYLVAAGDDHAIRIVHRRSGDTLWTLYGHYDWVQRVVILEDSLIQQLEPRELSMSVLSCGNDGTLRYWPNVLAQDAAHASESLVVHTGSTALMTMAVTSDERYVACAGFDHSIWIYDLDQVRSVAATPITPDKLFRFIPMKVISNACPDQRCMAFSGDSRWLAVGGRDGIVRAWEWQNFDAARKGEEDLSQKLHEGRVRSIEFSEDGTIVTTVGEDRHLVRYGLHDGKVHLNKQILGGKLMSLASICGHSAMAIAGADNTIRIIDTTSGEERNRLVGHEGSVAVMRCAQEELISGSFDTTIRFWEIERLTQPQAKTYEHPVTARYRDSGLTEPIH